jgi:DNA polymerase
MILYLDTETFSPVPINHGVHRYSAEAEILLATYAWDEGDVECIESPARGDLEELIEMADLVVMHNSGFDRTILRNVLGIEVPLKKLVDTMVIALMHGLPGGLGPLCEIMRVPIDLAKTDNGKRLIQRFCKPAPKSHKALRYDKHSHPDEWAEFIDYAKHDISAMRVLAKKLPKWNWRLDGNIAPSERQLWVLDQTINDRGFAIDMEFVAAAKAAVADQKKLLSQRIQDQTQGLVESATQRNQLLEYLREVLGIDLPDLKGGTLEKLLTLEGLPQDAVDIIATRLSAATTSTAKYTALSRSTSEDGRLRGTLQFCGASRTGRWAGRMFQPQNLPRPKSKAAEIENVIDAVKHGVDLDLLVPDPMSALSDAVRGCIVAGPCKKLVVSDLSNIEGRMLAWLAGETWKLKAFADFDKGIGFDLYKLAYARSFSVPPDQVSGDQRQIGKVQELALGYQGAVGAFSSMALAYGIELPSKPGTQMEVRSITFAREPAWLRMILPSGRSLCYAAPKLEEGKLTYMGVNQYTRKWSRLRTYGGKLVENATQAAARDVIAEGAVRAEEAGYSVVLSVHDELLTEVPDDNRYTVEGLNGILATRPLWAPDIPLAAGGFEGRRYRKG